MSFFIENSSPIERLKTIIKCSLEKGAFIKNFHCKFIGAWALIRSNKVHIDGFLMP
jgi:hypothetical protein